LILDKFSANIYITKICQHYFIFFKAFQRSLYSKQFIEFLYFYLITKFFYRDLQYLQYLFVGYSYWSIKRTLLYSSFSKYCRYFAIKSWYLYYTRISALFNSNSLSLCIYLDKRVFFLILFTIYCVNLSKDFRKDRFLLNTIVKNWIIFLYLFPRIIKICRNEKFNISKTVCWLFKNLLLNSISKSAK